MDPKVSAVVNKALDGLMLRQSATAQNIANANTAGYRPLRVSFESELKSASAKGPIAIRELAFRAVQLPSANGGNDKRLDLEMATASETSLRYGALIDVLSREINLTRTIIRGGQ